MTGRRAWLLVGALALIGVALRVAWQLRTGFYDAPLTFEEDEIARNMLTGRGYVYTFLGTDWVSFSLPGFPGLLALLHWLDGGPDRYRLIGLVQASLSVAGVVAAYDIGRRLLSRTAGLFAAAIVALHPALVIYPARAVISPVYDQALTAAVLVAMLAILARQDLARGLALGVVNAVAVLLRPNVAVAAELLLVPLAVRRPRLPILLATAFFLVANVTMTVRTQSILGTGPTPTFCMQLWVGNNPVGTGGAFATEGGSVFDRMPAELRERMAGRTEKEQGRLFCDAVWSWWVADIPHAIAWQATKYFYFWWFSPLAGILYPPGWIEAYRLAYGAEVVLAVIGGIAVWRQGWRPGLLLLIALMALIAASQTLFYVEGRHRLILEPAIAALAACGTIRVAAWARARLAIVRGDAVRVRAAP
jgi:hypothetical protein